MKKAFRPPRPFELRFSRDALQKKILRRIHLPSETEFARGLYQDDPENPESLVFAAVLDKKGVKRLKKLAKEVKRNRGFVSWGKLAIAGVVVVGFLVFYLVMKNLLLTGFLVDQLEGLFGAKAEVSGLDFDPFGGRLVWKSVEVADKDKPMTNLFHLGEANIHLDSWQLLNGKVILEQVQLPEIRFGTPRTSSGVLPRAARPAPQPAAPQRASSLSGYVDLQKFDATSLLQEQASKLQSVAIATSLNKDTADWTGAATQAQAVVQKKVQDFGAQFQDKIRQNLTSIRSVSDAQDALKKTVDVRSELDALQKESSDVQNDLIAKEKQYEQRARALQTAVGRDLDYIKGLVAHPQGLGADVLSGALRQILGPKLAQLESLAIRLPRVLDSLKQEKPRAAPPGKRPDRVVSFPTPSYPVFLLRQLTGTVALDDGQIALKVANVNSDPDRAGAPATFSLVYQNDAASATIEGAVDARTGANQVLRVTFVLTAVPWDFSDAGGALGLTTLQGKGWFKGAYVVAKSGDQAFTADGRVQTSKVEAQPGAFLGKISQKAILALHDKIQGTVEARVSAGTDPAITVHSDLDNAFVGALQSLWNDQVKTLNAQVSQQWNQKVTQALGPDGAKALQSLIGANQGDLTSLAGWKRTVDQRVSDLEKLQKTLSGGGLGNSLNKLGSGLGNLKLP